MVPQTVKKSEKSEIEYRFYNNCPENHRPKRIFRVLNEIRYDRVTGRHPTNQKDWDLVWKTGCKHFWLGMDVEPEETFVPWCEKQTGREVLWRNLHPTRILHGCPRAEHIIIEGEHPVFISPAKAEIVCREWDEAYLLMSIVTLWESCTKNWSVEHFKNGMRIDVVPPFEVTDVHKMFLLSHWEKQYNLLKNIRFPLKTDHYQQKVIAELQKNWHPVELRAKIVDMLCMKPAISKQETKEITWPVWRNEQMFLHDANSICGAFAMWAVRQSPYSIPTDLEIAAQYIHDNWELRFGKEFSSHNCDMIEKWLQEIFLGSPTIINWNNAKNHNREFVFSSRYDKPAPDDDIIGLDALARNIAHTLTLERLYDEQK